MHSQKVQVDARSYIVCRAKITVIYINDFLAAVIELFARLLVAAEEAAMLLYFISLFDEATSAAELYIYLLMSNELYNETIIFFL